jgi:hypothetical protein
LIAAGLALSAVQVLPTLELLRHSLRSEASYEFFSSFSMPRRFVLTFVAPYLMGGGDGNLFRVPYVGPSFYAEYVGYVGLATLALALIAWLAYVAVRRSGRFRDRAPATFEPLVGATAFGVVGAALLALGANALVLGPDAGPGQYLSAAIVALPMAGFYAVRAYRAMRTTGVAS